MIQNLIYCIYAYEETFGPKKCSILVMDMNGLMVLTKSKKFIYLNFV